MRFRLTLLAPAACILGIACPASAGTGGIAAGGPGAVEEVRSAVGEMHQWLDAGPYGARWREYLLDDRLQAQLALGAKTDPMAVAEILERYEGDAAGLQLPQFVKVRTALESWLAELDGPASIDQLPARVRAARSEFVPPTEADLGRARTELTEAIGRLDRRLTSEGPGGQAWRDFLRWDEMQAELARGDRADLEKIGEIHDKLASGHEGLDLYWFSDVRRALAGYIALTNARAEPRLKDYYESLLDQLADHLASMEEVPTADETAAVAGAIGWLRDAHQADHMIAAIRRCWGRPNLLAQVSGDVIAAGLGRPVEDTSPVRDVILGADVYGTGHTTGRLAAELVPNDREAEIALVFHGTSESDSVGYKGPARVCSDGTTRLVARTAARINPEGVRAAQAAAQAATSTTITGIALDRGGQLLERAAWRRACGQKSEAECIASRHAEGRLARRMDELVGQTVDRANHNLQAKFRGPLAMRRLMPELLRTSTTADALHLVALAADSRQLAAPGAPLPVVDRPDLALQLHQSMVNNWTARALAGMILTQERFEATVKAVLTELPKGLRSDRDRQPWTIIFAHQRPIWVTFAGGKFTFTMHAQGFEKGQRPYPAMDVTARYEIRKTAEGCRAVRLGELEIFPPDFVQGRDRLDVPQQVIRDMLKVRFEKIFPKEIVPQPITLPGTWAAAGRMALVQWECRDGWMVLAWKRIDTEPPAAAAPPVPPAAAR